MIAFKDILKRNGGVLSLVILVAVSVIHCKDPYTPKLNNTATNFLVVDGFLNDTTGQTMVKLSRTVAVNTANDSVIEENAAVVIQGNDGSRYPLTETIPGTYTASKLQINPQITYKVQITTSDRRVYESDYVPFKAVPPIDSITWDVINGDVNVYVNSHDVSGNSVYYYWSYEATWSYRSAYYSIIKWENDSIKNRDVKDDIYHCWQTVPSAGILIGSTKQLAHDVISRIQLLTEPLTSQKFQYEYSILVHQRTLTQDAYEYWDQLRKNTEDLGTIFGTLPSQNVTNVHCITAPGEPVVGYFMAGSETSTRIFIRTVDLPKSRHDTGYETCEQDTLKLFFVPYFSGAEALISPVYKGPGLYGYFTSTYDCVDCRLHGGTNVKPSWWIN